MARKDETPNEDNLEATTPSAVTSETPAEPAAKSGSRKGLMWGGAIAAGVLALGLSFAGGYAVAHEGNDRPHAPMTQGEERGSFEKGRDGSRQDSRDGRRSHDRNHTHDFSGDAPLRDGSQRGQQDGMRGEMQGPGMGDMTTPAPTETAPSEPTT